MRCLPRAAGCCRRCAACWIFSRRSSRPVISPDCGGLACRRSSAQRSQSTPFLLPSRFPLNTALAHVACRPPGKAHPHPGRKLPPRRTHCRALPQPRAVDPCPERGDHGQFAAGQLGGAARAWGVGAERSRTRPEDGRSSTHAHPVHRPESPHRPATGLPGDRHLAAAAPTDHQCHGHSRRLPARRSR
ncbi:hypothetical protein D3C79_858630 [compost metagenome]